MYLKYISSSKLRYLIAGGWNTLFGYLLGVYLYYSLNKDLHIVLIAIIANILSITMSYFTYKVFVFKTKGNWLTEYLRCYMVYGLTSTLSILLLWITVDLFKIDIWIAQGLTIILTVSISYFLHAKFTFKKTAT